MCGTTNAIGRGLGDVFTGGLGETNLGGGIFKKFRDTVGGALTLNPGAKYGTLFGGGGGGTDPNANVVAPGSGNWGPTDAAAESSRLAKLFDPIRKNSYAAIDTSTGDQFKKLRASQGARGVLRSGISDYPATELYKGATLAKGGVESDLAKLLGGTESSRSLFNTQAAYDTFRSDTDYNRKLALAQQIADANKKSTLQQILEGASAFAPFIATAFGGPMAGMATSGLSKIFGSTRPALYGGTTPALMSGGDLVGKQPDFSGYY